MNTASFQHPLATLNLACNDKKNSQDFAWNQADNYLLTQLSEYDASTTSVACINDSFGALSLCASKAQFDVSFFSDSAISQRWLSINAELNKMDCPNYFDISSLTSATADIYLLRLPKNLHFFQYILSILCQKKTATVIVAGMQKHWPKSFYTSSGDFFNQVTVLPGIKKAKCMILESPKVEATVSKTVEGYYQDFDLHYRNYPNVFSREKLDMGTRFFLEHLPDLSEQQSLLDLACGNGLLGILALSTYPHIKAEFIDESQFALQSCADTLALNDIKRNRYSLQQADVIENLTLQQFDVVFCNPPFHQLHTVSTDVAERMIKAAATALSQSGCLYLVANKHLPYKALLKRYFKRVSIKEKNEKFYIYHAIK